MDGIDAEMSISSIDPTSLANEARMLSSKGRLPILLVEGPRDKSVLAEFLLGPERCLPAYGFNNVVGAMNIIVGYGGNYACALVDADRVDEVPESLIGFIESTGLPDCDTVVLTTLPVVTRVLSVASDGRLAGPRAVRCVERAVELSSPLGLLARESRRSQWGLNLDGFPITEIVGGSGDVDVQRMVNLAVRRTRNPTLVEASVLAGYYAAATGHPLGAPCCRGHHLSAALVVAAAEAGERLQLGARAVESHARAAFGWQHFIASPLASAIRRLEHVLAMPLLREPLVAKRVVSTRTLGTSHRRVARKRAGTTALSASVRKFIWTPTGFSQRVVALDAPIGVSPRPVTSRCRALSCTIQR